VPPFFALPFPRRNRNRIKDPKPLTVTIELADKQWRTWKLGVGDGVGLGGFRVDVQGDRAVLVSQYEEPS
jgi:hypothetical protein